MTEKIGCKSCGNLILPTTTKKNNGLCMPCKNGYREDMVKHLVLDRLDDEYYKDQDDIETKMETFAVESGLVISGNNN